mmetsp:Transcript_36988/g.96938  ORF Transcript_36988/g.96938 Transcript_36988/m.96938 type:complete len:954 (-) Transcript_36988:61-2922(-)
MAAAASADVFESGLLAVPTEVMEGYVRRKPHNPSKSLFRSSSNRWNNRYLVLHEGTLHYYAKKGYPNAKRSYALLPGCTVIGPTNNPSHGLWTFQISFPESYTRSAASPAGDLDAAHNCSGMTSASCMLEGLDELGEDDELQSPPHAAGDNTSFDFRQQSTSSLETTHDSKGLQQHLGSMRREKAMRKAEHRRTKKVGKLEKKFEKTKKKERTRVAEFGVISRKECETWVGAIKSAILAMQPKEADQSSAFDDLKVPHMLDRKSSMVLTSPSQGIVPEEFLPNLQKTAVSKKRPEKIARQGMEGVDPTLSGSVSNLAVTDTASIGGDGRGPGLLQLPPLGPKYCVHAVDGNMVIYREIGERGLPTTKERIDAAQAYNEAVALGAIVGIVSAIALYCAGVGSPFQFLFGLGLALATLYFRVDRHELRDDVERHYMTTQIVRGSPSSIFETIMSEEQRPYWDAATTYFEILEKRDEHCDVIRMIQRPVWISSISMWSRSRELVLLRYWRRERDGSYFVFHQSTDHEKAPVRSEFVRGNVSSSAWVITPPTDLRQNGGRLTCRVTFLIDYDAKGLAHWLNKLGGFDDVFALPFLRNAVSLADALKARDYGTGGIEIEDTVGVMSPTTPGMGLGMSTMSKMRTMNTLRRRHSTTDMVDLQAYEVNYEGIVTGIRQKTVSAEPDSFYEMDACSFKVRGPNYGKDGDKTKIPAAPAGFHLVAFDVYNFEDGDERFNLGSREGSFPNRYRKLPEGRDGKFTYVINLIIPAKFGNMAVVMCFQPEDPMWRTSEALVYKMFRKMMDGDDATRKQRFKLLPQVVEGPYIIRKTVPVKPALVANKGLMCPFHKAEHYFEVDVDITSDSTAKYITKLALGYSASIVVDIAFLVEGREATELPEAVSGVIRFNRLDLKQHKVVAPGGSLGYTEVKGRSPHGEPPAKNDNSVRKRNTKVLRHVSEEV